MARRIHRTNRKKSNRKSKKIRRTNRKNSNRRFKRIRRTNRKNYKRLNSRRKITNRKYVKSKTFRGGMLGETPGSKPGLVRTVPSQLQPQPQPQPVHRSEGPVVIAPVVSFDVGTSDTIGRRKTMEDYMTLCGNFRGVRSDLMCVFDGHGGSEVAKYCAENITQVMHEVFDDQGVLDGRSEEDIFKLFNEAFNKMNGQLIKQGRASASRCGSTAVVLLKEGNMIHVANVGDTRAVLGRNGVAERLTFDHKPEEEKEKARIERAGGEVIAIDEGRVMRLNGGPSISRSFGDLHYVRYGLTAEPYTKTVQLTPEDKALVIACDGLWDVVSDQEAIDSVYEICSRGGDVNMAAAVLRDMAYKKGSTDNISVIVAILNEFDPYKDKEGNHEYVIYFKGGYGGTAPKRIKFDYNGNWPQVKKLSVRLTEKYPQIKKGMKLLSINNISVERMSSEQVDALLVMPVKFIFK